MKYGCIGEHLKHSFSKEIHSLLDSREYEIREVPRENLDRFMTERDFRAINVTIPYKELVIPHLYFTDEFAGRIGAVNTVVNRDGRLYGYNTDFYGMRALIDRIGASPKGKKVLILGTGGTSKTAVAVAESYGAREIVKVGRRGGDGAVTYAEMYERHSDAQFLINTTPVGMFPDTEASPVDLSRLPRLAGVIDAVYNPLRTELISDARVRGIAAEGGLYMLVAQAVRASEIFLDKAYPLGTVEEIFHRVSREKESLVLIGMPSSGKSTVGAILAKRLGRRLIDTDTLIEEMTGRKIPEIITCDGEAAFRDAEEEAVLLASKEVGAVIATGGGAILREANVRRLKRNGRLYFIDRPLEMLLPTDDRPLSSSPEAIGKRYSERYAIYLRSADARIDASVNADGVAEAVLGEFTK